jgi:hypothetical protein
MSEKTRLTMGEMAGLIGRQYGTRVPMWRMRSVIDRLADRGQVTIERVAAYRVVAASDIGVIVAELRRMGVIDCEVDA